MISKLIRYFLLFWLASLFSVGASWSQCVEIKWVMSFDHILARPDSRALMPLNVNFSEVYGGVGKVGLLITFNHEVMTFGAVKNVDPAVTVVEITQTDPGVIALTWNRQMAADRQALYLAGKMLDLEFSYVGGETAVAVSHSEVADVWGNYWHGHITPGTVKQLQAFEVSLRSVPEDIGAVLSGGGIYYEGDTVVVSANEPFNYSFLRWADDMPYTAIPDTPGSLTSSFLMPARDVSLAAKYEKIIENPAFLTLHTEGAGSMLVRGASITDTVIVAPRGEVFTLEAKPDTSWVFDRWHGDATGTNPVVSVVLSSDKEVTASFSEVFPVTLLASPDTIGALLTGGGLYRENSRVEIWANPPEGYVFVGWTAAAHDMALLADTSEMYTSFTMPARPVSFTAVFAPGLPDYYTLTLLASPDTIGAVLSQEGPGPHQKGARVDISASVVEGYLFSGWIHPSGGDVSFVDDPLKAETFLVMPAGHITLTATYEEVPPPKQHVLMVSVVGQGQVWVNGEEYEEQVRVDEGSELSVLAMAAGGWQFDGWEGDAGGADSLVVVHMDHDKHLTAVFSEKPPPDRLLLIDIVGEGVVTVDGDSLPGSHPFSLWFADAAQIGLKAAAAEGWLFEGWTGDLDSSAREVLLVMDADKTVTAIFTEVPPPPVYTLTFSITDPRGEIIADANISIDGTTYPPGIYVFAELPPGSYLYTVSCNGYFDVSGTAHLVDEDVHKAVVLFRDDTRAEREIYGFPRIRLYPNPVKDIAYIDLGQVMPPGTMQVKIMDVRGRVIDVSSTQNAGVLRLDFTGLVPGVYHMMILGDEIEEVISFLRL